MNEDDLRREFQNWNKNKKHEFSQKNDFWTPKEVFNALNERFGPFEVDLAASDENHLVDKYFTIDDNALLMEWNGSAWCNPPYVRQADKTTLKHWIMKARESVIDGDAHRVVMLIPAYTSNGYWHTDIFPYASHLVFFRYRLDFGGPFQRAGGASRQPSVAVVWSKVWSGASTQLLTMSNKGEWLTEEVWDRELLSLRLRNGVVAQGYFIEGDRFVVTAGSTANAKERPSCNRTTKQMRTQLLEEGAVDHLNDKLRFQRDVTFSSPSAAATAVRGMPSNGRALWC
jgi:phage N-6-adenine-methyltransferase